MAVFLALALTQAAAALPPPPADWSTLPPLQLDRLSSVTYADTMPVLRLAEQRRECRAGIGPMPVFEQGSTGRMVGLRLDLILLIAPDGRLLDILASPGPCDAIRNYARALLNTRYRSKLRAPRGSTAAWHLTSLGFRWEP